MAFLAPKSKSLAQRNKSPDGGKATKKKRNPIASGGLP
jgi:hypothetical protein